MASETTHERPEGKGYYVCNHCRTHYPKDVVFQYMDSGGWNVCPSCGEAWDWCWSPADE